MLHKIRIKKLMMFRRRKWHCWLKHPRKLYLHFYSKSTHLISLLNKHKPPHQNYLKAFRSDQTSRSKMQHPPLYQALDDLDRAISEAIGDTLQHLQDLQQLTRIILNEDSQHHLLLYFAVQPHDDRNLLLYSKRPQ